MRVLIIGGNSLLGRNLAGHLSNFCEVWCTVRDASIVRFPTDKNIQVLQVDLRLDFLEALPHDFDAIYFCAQSNMFRFFPEGAEDMLEVNLQAPVKIARWATEHGVQSFIFASSGGVYRGCNEKSFSEDEQIIADSDLGFYLSTKLGAEILLGNFANSFSGFTIARPFFMYGPEQNQDMLIPRLIDQIRRGIPIKLQGSDGIKINPIFISDAVASMACLLEKTGQNMYNIAGSEVISLRGLCELIGELLEREPVFELEPGCGEDIVADVSKMNLQLRPPTVTLREGLAKIL